MGTHVQSGWFPYRVPAQVARLVLRFCGPREHGRVACVCVLARELGRSPHSWPATLAHGHCLDPELADDPELAPAGQDVHVHVHVQVPATLLQSLRPERLGWTGDGFRQLGVPSHVALQTLSLATGRHDLHEWQPRNSCRLTARELEALAALPRLTTLLLWRCRLPDGLSALAASPVLRHLSIQPRYGGPLVLSELGAAGARLQSLHVVLPEVRDPNGAMRYDLAAIGAMGALETLALRLATEDRRHYAINCLMPFSLQRLPASLTALRIRDLPLSDRLAARVLEAPCLTSLAVDRDKVSTGTLGRLLGGQPPTLRELTLTTSAPDDIKSNWLEKLLAAASPSPTAAGRLTTFRLVGCRVTVGTMRALVAALAGLECLWLSGDTLTKRTLAPLAVCRAPIAALHLAGMGVTAPTLEAVVAHLPLLRRLDVGRTRISARSKLVKQLHARGVEIRLFPS